MWQGQFAVALASTTRVPPNCVPTKKTGSIVKEMGVNIGWALPAAKAELKGIVQIFLYEVAWDPHHLMTFPQLRAVRGVSILFGFCRK